MSDGVMFGGDYSTMARAATVERIFEAIAQEAPDDADLMSVVARRQEFDYQGGWSFETLSFGSLQKLERIVYGLTRDPDAPAKWREDWKRVFWMDLGRIQAMLKLRIRQLQEKADSR